MIPYLSHNWTFSLAEEQAAHNCPVVGSNPARSIATNTPLYVKKAHSTIVGVLFCWYIYQGEMIKVFIVIDRAIKDTTWLDVLTAFGPIVAVIVTSVLTLYLFNKSMKQQRDDFNQTFVRQNELLQKQISDNIIFQERADNLSEIQNIILTFVGEIDRYQTDLENDVMKKSDFYTEQWLRSFRKFVLIIGNDRDGEDIKQNFVANFKKLMNFSLLLLWLYINNHADDYVKYLSTNDKDFLEESWEHINKDVWDELSNGCKALSYTDKSQIIKYAHDRLNFNVTYLLGYADSYIQEERRRIAVGDNRL